MPRSIDLTAQSPHPLDRIRSAFANPAYWRSRLTAFEAGSPTLDSLRTEPSGETSVAMTMRFTHDQLPESLQRLRLPVLSVVQRERWYAPTEGGELRGDIAVNAPKTPMSGVGSVRLTPAGAGTRLTGTATVTVKLPLIGGPISRFIVGQLATGIVDIVGVTDAWLDANG